MNAEVASGLEIVLVADLVELVDAAHEAMVAQAARAEEVRGLAEPLFVVALLRRTGRSAERRRPHPVAGCCVQQQGAFFKRALVRTLAEPIAHPAELPLDQ